MGSSVVPLEIEPVHHGGKKTVKALGLDMPKTVLAPAHEAIEQRASPMTAIGPSRCSRQRRHFSRFRGIVLQNYFQHPGAQDRFKMALPAAT